ncbi:hypothetical protein [Psychrobacter sp. CAL346-MNA-CIBAN-0220]|uniref:hypothetical protein n=1 Tax=Psychrobacter sp. CAL346-MNA-CIBAN-0220 TaxID=3140457 RepID=UPI00331D8466
MSSKLKSSSNNPSAGQQRRQASILLLRLQWLLILLLIAALLWLYISQQRFQNHVNERLQSNAQVVTRLNEMDDRLFAISQPTLTKASSAVGSQAQNQLDLLRIQIQAVDRLLADNDDQAAIALLRGLHWQVSQSSNEIAPALTTVIKQNLTKDIERLQAQSAQPSPWQLQSLAIQNIQAFLHSHERLQLSTSKTPDTNNGTSAVLTRRQLIIHEVIMTLNLAIQASNMREQDQLIAYLRQARGQLKTIATDSLATSPTRQKNTATSNTSTRPMPTANNQNNIENKGLDTMKVPSDIPEVIVWLDKLIVNAPTSTPLLTTQLLDKPKR